MKKILIAVISFYQHFISPLAHQLFGTEIVCRYSPTCSVYSQEVITRYGVLKGSVLSLRRLVNCQPFFSI